MKTLLASLKLNAENFLNHADLLNMRGGRCDVATCINCVNTASGGPGNGSGACGYSCGCADCGCWSQCVQNVSSSCFSNFSTSSNGCYCNGGGGGAS